MVTREGVQPIAPELTEFLRSFTSQEDVFDSVTNSFSVSVQVSRQHYLLRPFLVGDRYICISTGYDQPPRAITTPLFQYCYVYDRLLNRHGKLKVAHTHVFEGELVRSIGGENRYDSSLIFLDAVTKETKSWVTDLQQSGTFSSVILLGRFQGVRSRRICLEEVEFESSGVLKGDATLHILPSENGKTLLPAVTPYETDDSSKDVKKYLCHVDSKNIHLLIKGKFDLTTVELKFHLGGDS